MKVTEQRGDVLVLPREEDQTSGGVQLNLYFTLDAYYCALFSRRLGLELG